MIDEILTKYPQIVQQLETIHETTLRELKLKMIVQEILIRELLSLFVIQGHLSAGVLYDDIMTSIKTAHLEIVRKRIAKEGTLYE